MLNLQPLRCEVFDDKFSIKLHYCVQRWNNIEISYRSYANVQVKQITSPSGNVTLVNKPPHHSIAVFDNISKNKAELQFLPKDVKMRRVVMSCMLRLGRRAQRVNGIGGLNNCTQNSKEA